VNFPHLYHSAHTAAPWMPRARGRSHDLIVVGAILAVLALLAGPVLAPPPAPQVSASAQLEAFVEKNAQSFDVPGQAAAPIVSRDAYSATPGIETLAASGTNHDWARLVMMLAGWPQSENNITVFTRWMRQENGPDDWWNRNNPLNNGWGSGGGGGLGSYDNLVIAAENAAEALHSNPGYASIVEAFATSAPTEVTEAAIWASPWATSHYANGSHWSYAPVPVITAPEDAWG
jgi:hypothetical protein